jgi:hypothetical protein
MALTQVTGAPATYWLNNRPGNNAEGTVYDCLVSDLAVGDFLCGPRAHVTATGSTTSGVRTLTVSRLGVSSTVAYVATTTIRIIR